MTEAPFRVLSIGECMAELAPSDVSGDFHLGFAGDTFNTAWYLARIQKDIDVSFFSAIGTDTISQQLRDTLTDGGISDRHLQALPDHTVGLYLISLDNGERSFSYWRGQSAAKRMADDPQLLADAMDDADLIYFSGITLAILDATARQTLVDALRAARAAGKVIAFDPNLRPRLWSDASVMTDAIMQGAAVSDIALPSFEDEASWFHDTNPRATVERYASAGATTIIVTDGSEPVHYLQGEERGTIAVPPLKSIVDTTAAGDSFNAACLAGIVANTPVVKSTARACRLAAQVVQAKGALVPVDLTLLNV